MINVNTVNDLYDVVKNMYLQFGSCRPGCIVEKAITEELWCMDDSALSWVHNTIIEAMPISLQRM